MNSSRFYFFPKCDRLILCEEVEHANSTITMSTQRPTTPQSANSAAGASVDSAKTPAGEASHDVAAKRETSEPDDIYKDQSRTRVILLIISVFMSMFLVALDRTIISTV